MHLGCCQLGVGIDARPSPVKAYNKDTKVPLDLGGVARSSVLLLCALCWLPLAPGSVPYIGPTGLVTERGHCLLYWQGTRLLIGPGCHPHRRLASKRPRNQKPAIAGLALPVTEATS